MTHLWEYDHPYYCNEGNFFWSPARDPEYVVHNEYGSWADFIDDWGDSDPDLNLVFRWDWQRSDPSDWSYEIENDPEFELPGDVLKLFFMLQRKAFCRSVHVNVTEDDESIVRDWLTKRAATMRAIWEPLLTLAGAA